MQLIMIAISHNSKLIIMITYISQLKTHNSKLKTHISQLKTEYEESIKTQTLSSDGGACRRDDVAPLFMQRQ